MSLKDFLPSLPIAVVLMGLFATDYAESEQSRDISWQEGLSMIERGGFVLPV